MVNVANDLSAQDQHLPSPDVGVEDTSTTGGSVMAAVEALRDAGAQVVGVAVIVERGAAPMIAAAGLEYFAAYQLADLGLD